MAFEKLVIQSLPAAVVIKNFVKNEKNSNYEIFLLEYLNKSKFFQEKSGNTNYISPSNESNGECDAITPKFQIDFKLLASASFLQGIQETSNSILSHSPGLVFYGNPRTTEKEYRLTWIHSLNILKTVEEFWHILLENKRKKENSDDYDILNVLKALKKKKNLLLFCPIKLSFEKEICFREATDEIGDFFMHYFNKLAQFREQVSNKETFILAVYNNDFLLYTFQSSEFKFLESLETDKSPTYTKLLQYSNPLFGIANIDE